jgi:hypothetical protein
MKMRPFGGKWDGGCAQGSFAAQQVSTRVPIFLNGALEFLPVLFWVGLRYTPVISKIFLMIIWRSNRMACIPDRHVRPPEQWPCSASSALAPWQGGARRSAAPPRATAGAGPPRRSGGAGIAARARRSRPFFLACSCVRRRAGATRAARDEAAWLGKLRSQACISVRPPGAGDPGSAGGDGFGVHLAAASTGRRTGAP